MSAIELTREQRAERLADLRAREAARKVTLGGVPLMDLPLHRRIAFAIYDPGAIVPRGDNYREPLHQWAARAIAYVLPELAELDRVRAELEGVRAELAEQKRLTKYSAGRAVFLRGELATRPSRSELLMVLAYDVETVIAPLKGEVRTGAEAILRAIRAMAAEPTVPTAADATPGGAS